MLPNTPNNQNVTKTFTPDETAQWFAGLDKRFASADVWCETPDGRLLIVHSPYKQYWGVPGGIIDAGETPKQAAIREVQEEVGIILDFDTLEFAMATSRVLGRLGYNYQFIFRASITQEQIDALVLQPGEIDQRAFISRDEVKGAAAEQRLGASIYDWANDITGYDEKVFRSETDTSDL